MKWFGISCLFLALSAAGLHAQADWRDVGGDPGQMKYSSLNQITPDNVSKLVKLWTYDTGDPSGGLRGWEITPIVINNVMYFPTNGKKIVALDASTGKEIWKVDVTTLGVKSPVHKYGVTYWPGDGKNKPRLLACTSDGFMLELDPRTGTLIKSAGNGGLIDLKAGVKFGSEYEPGQQPALYKNLAILSPTTGEQGRWGIAGDVRAFDILTGKVVWQFHTVPQPGDDNFGTWGPDGWQDRRGPGSWVPMSVDVPNGIVFVGLGNPTDQNYGGSRPGMDLYSDSVLALDATTGKLKWYFQVTHHDVDDWDINGPATMIDVKKDGKDIPAIAQTTKTGYLYIFNRLTGEPVFGVEERPVPQSDAPGEKLWPTEPYPLKPGPVSRVSMTRDEVAKLSPESTADCLAQYDKAVQEGPNTPYLMVPSLVFPSSEGGPTWGGPAYDPKSGLLVITTRNLGTIAQLHPSKSSGVLDSYAKRKIPFQDKDGYPCSPTPWGELVAYDANTANEVWRVPLGEFKELTKRGIPITGTPNQGGPIITGGGLVFVGATTDKMFRAFDEKTGKTLWETELSNNAASTPMTYQGANGKQYVVAVISSDVGNFNIPQVRPQGTDQLAAFGLP